MTFWPRDWLTSEDRWRRFICAGMQDSRSKEVSALLIYEGWEDIDGWLGNVLGIACLGDEALTHIKLWYVWKFQNHQEEKERKQSDKYY
jgi:hypothetical protein